MSNYKWTPERLALLHAEYRDATEWQPLLERINALPGSPISSRKSMNAKAAKLGLGKSPAAAAEIQVRKAEAGRRWGSARAKPEREREYHPPAIDDPGLRAYEWARQLFAQKKPPEAVRNITGLPLWRVYGIAGELRRERQTCAA